MLDAQRETAQSIMAAVEQQERMFKLGISPDKIQKIHISDKPEDIIEGELDE